MDDTQLASRSAPSVAHMLQGAVPGLTISTTSGRPGNSADLNIRGITSINGGSPLVLIDGAEGDLMKLNPNDVASISVIKDASAAAIYGARAAYGVVLVTTKEGDDSGKTRVSYSGRWAGTPPPPRPTTRPAATTRSTSTTCSGTPTQAPTTPTTQSRT